MWLFILIGFTVYYYDFTSKILQQKAKKQSFPSYSSKLSLDGLVKPYLTLKNQKNNNTAPAEFKNHKSPFYGVFSKETFGLPISMEEQKNYTEEYRDWRVYFPSLIKAINESKESNPSFNPKLFTTTGIVDVKTTNFEVGSELLATVTSIDGNGKAKKFGGDYYRARLSQNDSFRPDGVPCRVIDNENGTYSVKSFLLLEGTLNLEIKLVLPLEGIIDVINETSKMLCKEHGYVATLKTKETVECSFSYDW